MSWFEERWERRYQEMRWAQEMPPQSDPRPEPRPSPPPPPAREPRPPREPKAAARRTLRLKRERPGTRRPAAARKAEVVPQSVPNPRRSLPSELTGRLVDRWCTASVTAGWATPGYWWNEEVDAVVEAILDDGDHVTPCAELARRRARDGVSLAETLDDLGALFSAARLGSPPFQTLKAVSLAWTEASGQLSEAAGCVDPRSGLATTAHVRSRLFELYREAAWAGHNLGETHTLVFVELADRGEGGGDLWEDCLQMTDVAECMRAVFDAGQTIGLAGPGRAVAVVPRSTEVPRNVECLRRLLNDWHHFASGGPRPRIWVEPLPAASEAAGRLLNELPC
jgi:hypothetical protein